jgi:transcriptional regulator GlxA family with amidase domain
LWKINELLNPSGFNADESKRRKAFFKSLLQDVLAILLKHNRHDPEATPEWLKFSVEEMRKQENFRVGLRKFLELAGKSQEHLTRSMQLYYNTSPQKYITGLRISEAARLLRNTRMDISKIMYETGFNNTSYFRRCFKQKYGMPPVKYLKKSQQFF